MNLGKGPALDVFVTLVMWERAEGVKAGAWLNEGKLVRTLNTESTPPIAAGGEWPERESNLDGPRKEVLDVMDETSQGPLRERFEANADWGLEVLYRDIFDRTHRVIYRPNAVPNWGMTRIDRNA